MKSCSSSRDRPFNTNESTSSGTSVFLPNDDAPPKSSITSSSMNMSNGRMLNNSYDQMVNHLVVDIDGNNNNNNTNVDLYNNVHLLNDEPSLFMARFSQSERHNLDELKSFLFSNTNAGYCVDSVEPKCSELKRLIDEFKSNYSNKLDRFKSNRHLLQKFNSVIFLNSDLILKFQLNQDQFLNLRFDS